MFATDLRAQHPVLSAFMGAGRPVWTSVHLTCFRPWFLATYRIDDEEVSIGETVMLSNVGQILDLVAQVGGAESGTRVSLVHPIHDGGPDRWKLTPIRRLWKVVGRDDAPVGDAFDLADGTRFWDSFGLGADSPHELALLLELPD